MTQPPQSFLKYETVKPYRPGLDHAAENLCCLLREAHATGRLAVVSPLDLEWKHNFGIGLDWKWETYFDFGESRLVDAAGKEHPLPIAPHGLEPGAPVLAVGPGEPVPVDPGGGTLAIRHIRLTRHRLFRHDLPVDYSAIRVHLHPSTRVRELAQAVVAQLAALDGGRFVAVHVRRGDRLWQYPARLTEPAHIRKCLRRWEVPDGSVLFIMSDERKPDFFQPLQEHYSLFRYVDFPRLLSLVSADDSSLPDNYLLYQVEREVARSAELCLDTLPATGPSSGRQGFLVSEACWKWLRRLNALRRLIHRPIYRSKQICAILSRPVVVKDIASALARGQFRAAWRMASTGAR